MKGIETNICLGTDIIKGKYSILERIEDVIQKTSEKIDICERPHIVQDSSHKNNLLDSCKQSYERRMKIRYNTKIKKNLFFVKQFLSPKVRNLPHGDFLVLKENEILCNIGEIPSYYIFAPFSYGKTKEILKEQKDIFENL
ncbi:MAG TPA: hypothetical protein VK250_05225 [Nitrososphaeraceae archaeon]|nr:hypothetical protein [Nitrososphaeraceae archaeon]